MVWSEGNMSLKKPVTPPGIDPGTVRLVAQRLNHYATPGPIWYMYRTKICTATADDWYRLHSLSVKQHGHKQVRWLGVWYNPMRSDHCYLKQWLYDAYIMSSQVPLISLQKDATRNIGIFQIWKYYLVNSTSFNSKQLVWTRPLLFCDVMQHWLVCSDWSFGTAVLKCW